MSEVTETFDMSMEDISRRENSVVAVLEPSDEASLSSIIEISHFFLVSSGIGHCIWSITIIFQSTTKYLIFSLSLQKILG